MRMMARAIGCVVLTAGIGLPGLAAAAQGEVCNTQPKAFSAGPLDNELVFRCKTLGDVTVPQIYQKGWRLVSVMPQMIVNPSNPMDQKASWVAIIEKL